MAIVFVQGSAVDSADHLSITPTAGNLIIAALLSQSPADNATISDTRSNSWTKFTGAPVSDPTGFALTAFWCIANGSLSTTITFAAYTPSESIMVAEYSGIAAASPADGSQGNPGTDTGATDGITSGNLTTAADGDLIVGVVGYLAAADPVGGTGYTLRPTASITGSPPFVNTAWEDKVQSAHAAVAATWTNAGGSADYLALAGAFKDAGGGGSVTTAQLAGALAQQRGFALGAVYV